MIFKKLRKGGNALITMHRDSPSNTQTYIDLLAYK